MKQSLGFAFSDGLLCLAMRQRLIPGLPKQQTTKAMNQSLTRAFPAEHSTLRSGYNRRKSLARRMRQVQAIALRRRSHLCTQAEKDVLLIHKAWDALAT